MLPRTVFWYDSDQYLHGLTGVDQGEGNGVPDHKDTDLSFPDADLVPVSFRVTPVLEWGVMELHVPEEVTIWKDPRKVEKLKARSWDLTDPAERSRFVDLLSQPNDNEVKKVFIEGLSPAREQVLSLRYNPGSVVSRDDMKVTVYPLQTLHLVTHDPQFEAQCAYGNPKVKQAEAMDNRVVVAYSCPREEAHKYDAALYDVAEGVAGNGMICQGYRQGWQDGKVTWVFRTAPRGGGSGAETDSEGNIYVEGEKLSEGADKGNYWTDYYVKVEKWDSGKTVRQYDVIVSHLVSDIGFSPNVVKGQTVNPYEHEASVAWQNPHWPYPPEEKGWGLVFHYDLLSDVDDLFFRFSNAEPNSGDMGGTHELVLNSWWKKRHGHSSVQSMKAKWEGYDASVPEKAQRIYNWPNEAKHTGRALSPRDTVAEGLYLFEIKVHHPADSTQLQTIQVELEVDYGLDLSGGGN